METQICSRPLRLSPLKNSLFAVKLVNNEIGPCAEELYQVICQRAGLNA